MGTQLGFPTANIKLDYDLYLPKYGVYAVKIFFKDQMYFGMLNLGTRPSISDDSFAIEVHLFDFDTFKFIYSLNYFPESN